MDETSVEQLLARARQAIGAGNLVDAQGACDQILRSNPRHAEAIHILGFLAHRAGDTPVAMELISRAAEIEPANGIYAHNLADLHAATGKLEQAEQLYRRSIQLNPQFAPSLVKLGIILEQKGELDESLKLYRQAAAIAPGYAMAHCNLADVLAKLGQASEAIASYTRALELNPNFAEAFCNRGLVLAATGQPRQAANDLANALRINPNLPDAAFALGNVLHRLGQIEQAAQAWAHSLQLNPGLAPAYANLGLTLMNLGEYGRAEKTLEHGLAIDSQHLDLQINRGLLQLSHGNYADGWKAYDLRWQTPAFANYGPNYAIPRWNGEEIRGKRLLLWHEQGLGDTIQFIRYAEMLKSDLGLAEIIFAGPQALHELLRSMPAIDRIVLREDPAPPADVQSPLLRLPALLGTTLETIPRNIPYLQARPEQIHAWRSKLDPYSSKRIGIAWTGSALNTLNRFRSVSPELFERFARIPGVQLFSLQKDAAPPSGAVDLSKELNDFADTAAAMMNLDLIISIDTAIAHLAGALGRECWTLLSAGADHRWLLNRSDSPWYPTMRLFRQPRMKDWPAVFEQVAKELADWVQNGGERLT